MPSKSIVIKIGTSSLVAESGDVNLSSLAAIVETAAAIQRAGHSVVLVSSGAVGTGCARLGLKSRPSSLAKKQALAAIGQLRLMRMYDDLFATLSCVCAQARAVSNPTMFALLILRLLGIIVV